MVDHIRAQWWAILVAGIIVAASYAAHSPISGEHTRIEDVVAGTAYYPWNARWLLPMIFGHILSPEVTHSLLFRAAICFVSFVSAAALLPAFVRRLDLNEAAQPFVFPCFVIICIAHYCLSAIYSPFYVFDFPSIPFYLIAFLLLTDGRKWPMLAGMFATLVFFWNRESALAAPLQALVWWARPKSESRMLTKNGALSIATIALAFAIRFIRGGESNITAQFFSDGHVRLLVNLYEIATQWGGFLSLILIGFGAVFYVPLVIGRQSRTMKAYLVGSIIPFVILLFLGNLTEIRTFSEFIPVFSCLLAYGMAMANPLAVPAEPSSVARKSAWPPRSRLAGFPATEAAHLEVRGQGH